jgi:hypothetical protein
VLVTRSQLQAALAAAGGRTGSWRVPDTAEILSAIALSAAAFQGQADCDLEYGLRVTCFQIETRPVDTGRGTPRDRQWITADLSHACLAAVALTHMNGLRMWPQYTSGDYRRFLPEAYPPPIQRPEAEVPFQEATVFPGVSLRELMKACGWLAPTDADANRIAWDNGAEYAAEIPAGSIVRIPVQRGW